MFRVGTICLVADVLLQAETLFAATLPINTIPCGRQAEYDPVTDTSAAGIQCSEIYWTQIRGDAGSIGDPVSGGFYSTPAGKTTLIADAVFVYDVIGYDRFLGEFRVFQKDVQNPGQVWLADGDFPTGVIGAPREYNKFGRARDPNARNNIDKRNTAYSRLRNWTIKLQDKPPPTRNSFRIKTPDPVGGIRGGTGSGFSIFTQSDSWFSGEIDFTGLLSTESFEFSYTWLDIAPGDFMEFMFNGQRVWTSLSEEEVVGDFVFGSFLLGDMAGKKGEFTMYLHNTDSSDRSEFVYLDPESLTQPPAVPLSTSLSLSLGAFGAFAGVAALKRGRRQKRSSTGSGSGCTCTNEDTNKL